MYERNGAFHHPRAGFQEQFDDGDALYPREVKRPLDEDTGLMVKLVKASEKAEEEDFQSSTSSSPNHHQCIYYHSNWPHAA